MHLQTVKNKQMNGLKKPVESNMQQTALFTDTALETAKHFIRNYVYRGDKPEWLVHMGGSSPQSYSVSINGYLNGKLYGGDKILVERDMNGVEVNKAFDKKTVYEEVKRELTSGTGVKLTS